MGLTGAILYYFVLTRIQALAILVAIFLVFGVLEITRCFSGRWNDYLVDKVFGAIARPSERYRVNSSTFYVMALIIIVLFLPKLPVIAAVLVLAFADPAASLIGKRWGRLTLFRDKTLAGSLAFFTVGTLAVASFLLVAASDLGVMHIAGASSVSYTHLPFILLPHSQVSQAALKFRAGYRPRGYFVPVYWSEVF